MNHTRQMWNNVVSLAFTDCPTNWINGAEYGCYFINKEEVPLLDRYEAQDYCSLIDSRSYLVEIRNQDIEMFLQSQEEFSDDFWWIGAVYDTEVTMIIHLIWYLGQKRFTHSFQRFGNGFGEIVKNHWNTQIGVKINQTMVVKVKPVQLMHLQMAMHGMMSLVITLLLVDLFASFVHLTPKSARVNFIFLSHKNQNIHA